MSLKAHDLAVLLKIVASYQEWTIAKLAREMYLSASEIHAAFGRTEKAKLFNSESRFVRIAALEEFMCHGIQYSFFAIKGELTRGMPTSVAAPPLVDKHFDEPEIPPVWPHPMGMKRGYCIEPLYKRAADAAAADGLFYELLALTDALREGSSRTRSVAMDELKRRLSDYEKRGEKRKWLNGEML